MEHVQAGDSYVATGRSCTGAADPCPYRLHKPETTGTTNPGQQARPVTWKMTLTAARREARHPEGLLSGSEHRGGAQGSGASRLHVCL